MGLLFVCDSNICLYMFLQIKIKTVVLNALGHDKDISLASLALESVWLITLDLQFTLWVYPAAKALSYAKQCRCTI